MTIISGWHDACGRQASPNYNARPNHTEISLLVIHNISLPPGQFGTGCVEQFFCNQLDPKQHPYFNQIESLKVSAHFLIERDGKTTQFVSCYDRAWHAGESSFAGIPNCNDYSIGIELEGTDDLDYEPIQYEVLADLSIDIMRTFPKIKLERVVGHSDIAPERKTDPGPAFDWGRYRALVSR